MNRQDFIKGLIAIGAIGLLPKSIYKHYQKYYLLQFFIAGFRFYNGPNLLAQIKEGDLLQLIREPENKHDKAAIALYWKNEKIGYVPQAENSVLSKLIDANALELLAEITHLNNNVEPWENLAVAISFLKNDNKIPDSAVYLTQLETPQYHSYKHEDGSITRVIFEDQNEDLESDLDWYDYFVSNSKDDGIYGIIHASNVAPGYPYGIETGHYLLVNKKRVADNKTMEEIIAKAETYLGELNELFDLEGYVLLSTSEAEQLVSKISNISDVVDKLGRHYIELIFD